MISTKDHLRLAAILRNHRYYAKRSTGRHLLWLSLRDDIMALLAQDTYFDREAFLMLTELPSPDLGELIRRRTLDCISPSNGG